MAHDHHARSYGRAFAIGMVLRRRLRRDRSRFMAGWSAIVLAQRKPTRRRTYGLRKTTVIAALANAVCLLVAIGAVLWGRDDMNIRARLRAARISVAMRRGRARYLPSRRFRSSGAPNIEKRFRKARRVVIVERNDARPFERRGAHDPNSRPSTGAIARTSRERPLHVTASEGHETQASG